jgi:hypothetical protein
MNYAPSFPVCKLYKRTSARGNTYFVGRWGGARVTLLLSDENTDDGGEVWHLMLSEAPAKREGTPPKPRGDARKRDWQRPTDTDARPAGRMAHEYASPF